MSPPSMRARHVIAWVGAVCALLAFVAGLLDFCTHHWILGIVMWFLTVWNTCSSHANYKIYEEGTKKKPAA